MFMTHTYIGFRLKTSLFVNCFVQYILIQLHIMCLSTRVYYIYVNHTRLVRRMTNKTYPFMNAARTATPQTAKTVTNF